MLKNNYYYITDDRGMYVDTLKSVKELAQFLKRPLESVYASMSLNRKLKRKYYILKDYSGNKYKVEDTIQFFGKGNVK